MKIEIEVTDFYFEDGDLESSLKQYIVNQAVYEIYRKIEVNAKNQLYEQINELINKTMREKISVLIDEVIKTGEYPRKYSNEKGTIEEYIKDSLSDASRWDTFSEKIKKLADQNVKEIKERYDLLFASQIVSKLGENGLLNSEAAKLLLKDK